jgi:sodium-dependent dicarboxylate transporter 2/3/5
VTTLVQNPNRTASSIGLWLGPALAALLLTFGDLQPGQPMVTRCAAVTLWMAVWWTTEAVPIWATALLPVVLFPSLGISSGKVVASHYFNHIIFLFLGGFLLALAMQRWNLHKRIALATLSVFGVQPARLLMGLMAVSAMLSMWVSNTSTTMMMVPIVLSVIAELEELEGKEKVHRYATGLLLGVAYAASLGGIATLVGTPPNLTLARSYSELFPQMPELSMVRWIMFAAPLSLVLLALLWRYLSWRFCPVSWDRGMDKDQFKKEYLALGSPSREEKIIFATFVSLVALWLTRADLNLGFFLFKGWAGIFENPKFLNDGTVAIAAALFLFAVPAHRDGARRILESETVTRLPWGIVLLFGGGLALAKGFSVSGLSEWTGSAFEGLGGLHPLLFITFLCLAVSFLTELTSNTATAEMLMPVLAAVAVSLEWNPLLLMVPAALACSMAFMLPVATPPNAIVFGSGRLTIRDMMRAGFAVNLVCALVCSAAVWWWGGLVLGLN